MKTAPSDGPSPMAAQGRRPPLNPSRRPLTQSLRRGPTQARLRLAARRPRPRRAAQCLLSSVRPVTSPTRTRTRAGACVCLLWRGPGGGGVCAARARIAPLRAVRNGTRRAAAERDDGQVWRAQGQRKHFGRRLDGPRGPAWAVCARDAAQHATQTAGPRAASRGPPVLAQGRRGT